MPPTVLHHLATLFLLDLPDGPDLAARFLHGDRRARAAPAVRAARHLCQAADEAARLGLFDGPFATALAVELDMRLDRAFAQLDGKEAA